MECRSAVMGKFHFRCRTHARFDVVDRHFLPLDEEAHFWTMVDQPVPACTRASHPVSSLGSSQVHQTMFSGGTFTVALPCLYHCLVQVLAVQQDRRFLWLRRLALAPEGGGGQSGRPAVGLRTRARSSAVLVAELLAALGGIAGAPASCAQRSAQ